MKTTTVLYKVDRYFNYYFVSGSQSLYTLLLIFSFCLFSFSNAFGVVKTFTGVGNFSSAVLWNGATLPAAGDDLIINGGCTIDNNVLTDNIAYGNLVIGNTSAIILKWSISGTNRLNVSNVSSSFAGSSLDMTNGGTLIIRGTWASANLAFTPGAGTIDIRSSITLPSAYATYTNLTINGASITVSLGVNTTVNGTLTFTSGTITTGANTLSLSSTGTVSRTSGHVIGNFKKNIATGATSKTFEIGDATNYTPLAIAFASVTTAGNLTASTASNDHGNIGSATFNPLKTTNRSWTLTIYEL
jgi:hypothetical protein